MGVYIKGMELPNEGVEWICFVRFTNRTAEFFDPTDESESVFYEAVEIPEHGRLIDADKLHDAMYHRAFETDGDTMWQSGCWVRYRAIEQTMDAAPTVIPKEEA